MSRKNTEFSDTREYAENTERWLMAIRCPNRNGGLGKNRLIYLRRFIASAAKYRALMLALAGGFIITALQILLAVFLSCKGSVQAGWRSFYNYDSEWFVTVASYGYIDPNWKEGQSPQDPFAACTSEEFKSPRIRAQNNAHFFPAYPLLCRAVHYVTGLDWAATLLVTAAVANCGFWIYFLLLSQRWRFSAGVTAVAASFVVMHPSSFYLISGYSEPLFLFALFGFFYWVERDGPTARIIAGLHGFVLTATRIVGMPLLFYPLIRTWSHEGAWHDSQGTRLLRYVRQLPVVLLTAAGAGAFLLFLQFQFGDWSLFIKSAERGWGVRADYTAPFKLRTYNLALSSWNEYPLDPGVFNRFCAQLCLMCFAFFAAAEIAIWRAGNRSAWRDRIGLYVCALFLFAMPIISHARVGLFCFSRFSILPAAILALAGGHLATTAPSGLLRWARWPLGVALVGFTIANALLTMRFARGGPWGWLA
jgi:hypothetical protein